MYPYIVSGAQGGGGWGEGGLTKIISHNKRIYVSPYINDFKQTDSI